MRKINYDRLKEANPEEFGAILSRLVTGYDENLIGEKMTISQAVAFYNKTLELQIRSIDAIMQMIEREDPEFVSNFADMEMGYYYDTINKDDNMLILEGSALPLADEIIAQQETLTEELIGYTKGMLSPDDDDVLEKECIIDDEDLEYPDVDLTDEDMVLPVNITVNGEPASLVIIDTENVHNDAPPVFVAGQKNRLEKAHAFATASKMSPSEIYDKIKEKVYKQDDYCKAASVILYNHLHGINSTNIVSGPSGCGKTFLWETIRDEVYPNVCFLDGKSVTQAGFKGINLGELLQTIPFKEGIVVIDEFDKLITANFDSHGTNISRQIQGEFLKVLDSGFIKKCEEGHIFQSTDKITFILCGSFFDKADEKTEEDKSIGFNASLEKKQSYETNITLEDMIEFGLLKEIAGRITDVVNVNPLTVEDYITFIKDFNNSAVKQIEELYGRTLKISDKKIREIAEESFKNELGLRKAIGILKSNMNRRIFDNPEEEEVDLG